MRSVKGREGRGSVKVRNVRGEEFERRGNVRSVKVRNVKSVKGRERECERKGEGV